MVTRDVTLAASDPALSQIRFVFRPRDMTIINLRRTVFVLLALVGAYTGGWAYFAPENWFRHFPGFGHSWLPQLGPYNEHLAKDSGAMFLALAVLSVLALRWVHNDRIVQISGATWLVFNVLHMIYHLRMLHVYNTLDRTLNIVLLGFLVVIAVPLLIPSRQRRDA